MLIELWNSSQNVLDEKVVTVPCGVVRKWENGDDSQLLGKDSWEVEQRKFKGWGCWGTGDGRSSRMHLCKELTPQFPLLFSVSSPGMSPLGDLSPTFPFILCSLWTRTAFHDLLPFPSFPRIGLASYRIPKWLSPSNWRLVLLSPVYVSSMCCGVKALSQRMDSMYNISERSVFTSGV